MGIRQLTGLLAAFAAGGLVVAFANAGSVSATFQQEASAGVSIGVGTFGCSLSAAPADGTNGLTITQHGKNVDIEFGPQDGSTAGSASAELTLHNDGSMPISAEWTLESPTDDTSAITAKLEVDGGSPSSLPKSGDTATATLTFTWSAAITSASLSANVEVVCNEAASSSQPLRQSPRALTAPASAGFTQYLSATAAVTVEPGDDQCDAINRDAEGICHEEPQCTEEELGTADRCPAQPQCDATKGDSPDPYCTTDQCGATAGSNPCPDPNADPMCTGSQVLQDGICVTPESEATCPAGQTLIDGACAPAEPPEGDCTDGVNPGGTEPGDGGCPDPANGTTP